MITFILLGVFFLIAVTFALVAYSSNNRKRAGMKPMPTAPDGANGKPARAAGQGN